MKNSTELSKRYEYFRSVVILPKDDSIEEDYFVGYVSLNEYTQLVSNEPMARKSHITLSLKLPCSEVPTMLLFCTKGDLQHNISKEIFDELVKKSITAPLDVWLYMSDFTTRTHERKTPHFM